MMFSGAAVLCVMDVALLHCYSFVALECLMKHQSNILN